MVTASVCPAHHTIKVKHRRARLLVAPGDTTIGVDGITRGAVF
jgi:hypothetical protein